MNTFEAIQEDINNLKVGADENLIDLANELHQQFNTASNASWSREELADFIKSDNDVLDSDVVDSETGLYEDIRNIQDAIINFFGEDEASKKH